VQEELNQLLMRQYQQVTKKAVSRQPSAKTFILCLADS
jgi:hypothetical protein